MHFNECEVQPAMSGMGDSQIMMLNNICNIYDIGALGVLVAEVTFEFLSLGGVENLQVNGAPIFLGDIEMAPRGDRSGRDLLAGDLSGSRGSARRGPPGQGPVDKLLLGGQEFWVDNICVKVHTSSGVTPQPRRAAWS